MARNLRDIRRKMKAIKSTKQVTKAMEMEAASKMRRAVLNAHMLRRYALTAWKILERIAKIHSDLHPYLAMREPKKTLIILFTSDRGLCGGLNAQMQRLAQQYAKAVREVEGFERLDFIAVGRKGQQYLARTGQSIVAAFPALSNRPTFKDALPIVRFATDAFLKSDYDQVVMLYPDCVSALVQEPTSKRLLPFSRSDLHAMIESAIPQRKTRSVEKISAVPVQEKEIEEFLFEPSPEAVLQVIIPQLTETQLYQAILESCASEHSARMVAMRNASDNASDLLDDLTLTYNQTRQANITAELSELSAAAAALG